MSFFREGRVIGVEEVPRKMGMLSQNVVLLLIGTNWVLKVSPNEHSPLASTEAPLTQVKHLLADSHVLHKEGQISHH